MPDWPDWGKTLQELKGKTLIVEGRKDVQALDRLGLPRAVPLNGRPLIRVVEELPPGREVVILTDFDRQGRKLNAQLSSLLQRYKIRTNPRLRHMMREMGKTRIEDFNGVAESMAVVKIKRSDTHGEVGANINQVHYQGTDFSKRGYRKA